MEWVESENLKMLLKPVSSLSTGGQLRLLSVKPQSNFMVFPCTLVRRASLTFPVPCPRTRHACILSVNVVLILLYVNRNSVFLIHLFNTRFMVFHNYF